MPTATRAECATAADIWRWLVANDSGISVDEYLEIILDEEMSEFEKDGNPDDLDGYEAQRRGY